MVSWKYILFFLLVGIVLTIGCIKDDVNVSHAPQTRVVGSEVIGGKYNLTIVETQVRINNTVHNMKKIQYVKDGEVIEPDMMLPDDARPGLDWMRENTPDDAIVLSWWDWGHMIRAYGEREPVVDAPSREILTKTVSEYIGKSRDDIECDGCVEHGIIMDIARAFSEDDSEIMRKVMEKYGASIFYVMATDKDLSYAFYVSYGAEPVDALSDEFSRTVIGRACDGELLAGFDLVYLDDVSRIYLLND